MAKNAKAWRWLKAPVSRLDDPRWGKLSDHFYRRLHEFYYFAGRVGDSGLLPPEEDMAWTLRSDIEGVHEDLAALAEQGYLSNRKGRWYLTDFEESQAPYDPTGAERKRRQRARQKSCHGVTRDVTCDMSREVEVEVEEESESEQEKNKPCGIAVAIPPRALFHERTKDGHYRLFDENRICQDYCTKAEAMKYPELRR